MINEISETLTQIMKGYEDKLELDSVEIHGDNKVEAVIWTSNYDYGISICILSDFTYDGFVIDAKTETFLSNRTLRAPNLQALSKEIQFDLSYAAKLT